jgi:hypothetical protein
MFNFGRIVKSQSSQISFSCTYTFYHLHWLKGIVNYHFYERVIVLMHPYFSIYVDHQVVHY